jgi:hypothetical protein
VKHGEARSATYTWVYNTDMELETIFAHILPEPYAGLSASRFWDSAFFRVFSGALRYNRERDILALYQAVWCFRAYRERVVAIRTVMVRTH